MKCSAFAQIDNWKRIMLRTKENIERNVNAFEVFFISKCGLQFDIYFYSYQKEIDDKEQG